jgi:hypothetical protein
MEKVMHAIADKDYDKIKMKKGKELFLLGLSLLPSPCRRHRSCAEGLAVLECTPSASSRR